MSPLSGAPQRGQATRRLRLMALTALVALVHLWIAGQHVPPRLGEGDADRTPQRIEVAFVRELAPADPAPRPPSPPSRPLNARAPAPAASSPDAASQQEELRSAAEKVLDLAADRPGESAAMEPAPASASESPTAGSVPGALASPPAATALSTAPATMAAAASQPTAFEWPPSTRLTYTLTGNYRGPVQGQAQVEWLRSGTRYQVHLDVSVGPSFAPLLSRRITSEGEITAQGLVPQRYDEETRIAWREPRRLTIALESERVRLPSGASFPRPEGVQDSASQFVQMTWLFTTQPELLQAGRSVEMPLALPRRVEPWLYDVLQTESLQTPAGLVQAVHVRPRREGRDGDLTAEFWVAPSLQNLPVRIVIRQDAQTQIDLLIDRLPQQAQQAQPGR